jgi:hypothetical protein
MNIKNFGQKLRVEESSSTKVKKEKEIFIENINLLEQCITRSENLAVLFGIDLCDYEDPFWAVIENMLLLKYGEAIYELIFWYLYDRIDEDGKAHSLIFEEEGKEPKEIKIKNASDLWKFIEKNILIKK